MNFYKKTILPLLLDYSMKKKYLNTYRRQVAEQATGEILEIGFGPGLNIPYYHNIKKLYALDPSIELLALAQKRIKNTNFPIEYIRASAEKIPLPDNSIDTVVSTWSFCSISQTTPAVKEIFRALKTNGKFIFVEHGKSPIKIVSQCQRLITPISKLIAGGCHMDRDINRIIKNGNFEIIKLEESHPRSIFYFMSQGVAIPKK